MNAPVKVQLNGVQAEIGALINVVGVGLGLSLSTDGEGITTLTMTGGYSQVVGEGITTLTMTGGYSQVDGGVPGSIYTGPMNIDGGYYNSNFGSTPTFSGGTP